MTACACGKVRFEVNGTRIVIATETPDDQALVTNVGGGVFKIEHLPCQTCVTIRS